MLDAADPKRRRIMLAAKVEDMLNTVVRQVAFYYFETLLHNERRSGELVPDRIAELWLRVQKESLGPAFEFTPDYGVYWAYVPHFVHSPFYVYAYAFGDCLVNALYSVFQSGHPGFQAKYLAMLRAGGTKRHKELLAPFGLDASDPAFERSFEPELFDISEDSYEGLLEHILCLCEVTGKPPANGHHFAVETLIKLTLAFGVHF